MIMRGRDSGFVYFVEATGQSVIKIGYSYDVWNRMYNLAGAGRQKLELIARIPGGCRYEWTILRKFDHLCTQGEWFLDCAEIREFIAREIIPNVPDVDPEMINHAYCAIWNTITRHNARQRELLEWFEGTGGIEHLDFLKMMVGAEKALVPSEYMDAGMTCPEAIKVAANAILREMNLEISMREELLQRNNIPPN